MKPEDSGQAPTVEDLAKEIDSLRKQNEKLEAENERLRKELEESLRRLKRHAAPFSRGKRKKKPKRPGRKSGAEYGKQIIRFFEGVGPDSTETTAAALGRRLE